MTHAPRTTALPVFPADRKGMATRNSSGLVLNAVYGVLQLVAAANARGAVVRSNSPVTIRPLLRSSVASVAISTIGSFFG